MSSSASSSLSSSKGSSSASSFSSSSPPWTVDLSLPDLPAAALAPRASSSSSRSKSTSGSGDGGREDLLFHQEQLALQQLDAVSDLNAQFGAEIEIPSLTGHKEKLEERKNRIDNAGSDWNYMTAGDDSEEAKRDLKLLSMRRVLDPKRFYKREPKQPRPKYYQIGTVVEDGSDFYASRIPNRERKQHFVEEVLSDLSKKQYLKRKFLQIQQQRQPSQFRPRAHQKKRKRT